MSIMQLAAGASVYAVALALALALARAAARGDRASGAKGTHDRPSDYEIEQWRNQ